MSDETPKLVRKKRSDMGATLWTDRDVFALTWIGQQYTIRLDQLQRLLGQRPGHGAKYPNWISEGSARDVVRRWEKAGWVEHQQIRAKEPFWIWPTRLGLRTLNLPYNYKNIVQTNLVDLDHLAAINEIRLKESDGDDQIEWSSERQLSQGIIREKGKELVHRPDGEMYWDGGQIVAIEAELSTKKPPELRENLMELIRGEGYLRLKEQYGKEKAVAMSQSYRSRYKEIWYFCPKPVRKQVRRARAELLKQGALIEAEADRLFILWYPLTRTQEEEAQEKHEDDEGFDLNLEAHLGRQRR